MDTAGRPRSRPFGSRGGAQSRSLCRAAALVIVLVGAASVTGLGQGRTDVATLRNGDRITGEIIRLERGRLEFKTDDAGTLHLEWDKLASVVTARVVEVVAGDGARYLGSLGAADARSIAVVGTGGVTITLEMARVTIIRRMGAGFWNTLDGSVDAGFNSSRSSGVTQLNLNSSTVSQRPAAKARLAASLTVTRTESEEEGDDRGTVEASYLRYPWREWFIWGALRFDRNESLGLALRSQLGISVGPRLINSNRGQMTCGAGLAVNDERGVDVEPTRNLEGLFVFASSFYTYDRPTTTLDISLQYLPSLSNTGRNRIQLDAAVKQEFWKDLFAGLSLYNSYDSRPPNPASNSNDVGVVLSVGWTY